MYESFYQLSSDPFRLLPDPGICFPHRSCARAWAYLRYALKRGEGIVVVTGPPGTGKTTLAERLLNELNPSKVVSARLIANDLNPTDLLRKLAYSFGLAVEGMDRAMLAHRIERYLIELEHSQRRALALIDEAQTLSHQSLEAMRLLTDLQSRSRAVFQLILLGQEELEGVMSAPGMEQFQQRVIASCRLQRMDLTETKAYMEYRLGYADWGGDPSINGPAVKAIFDYSRGLPRHVNKICSRLLLHGCTEEKHALNERDVKAVVRDLRDELLAPLTGDMDYQGAGTSGVFDPAHELALVPNTSVPAAQPAGPPDPAAAGQPGRNGRPTAGVRPTPSAQGRRDDVMRPRRPTLRWPHTLRRWLQRRGAGPERAPAAYQGTAPAVPLVERVRRAGWTTAPHHFATGLAVLSSALVAIVAVQIGQGLMPPIAPYADEAPLLAPGAPPAAVESDPPLGSSGTPAHRPARGGAVGPLALDAGTDWQAAGWASLADAAEGAATERLTVADPAAAQDVDGWRLAGIAGASGASESVLSATLDGMVSDAVVDRAVAVTGGAEVWSLEPSLPVPDQGETSAASDTGGIAEAVAVDSVAADADLGAEGGPADGLIIVAAQAPELGLVSYPPPGLSAGAAPPLAAVLGYPVVAQGDTPAAAKAGAADAARPETAGAASADGVAPSAPTADATAAMQAEVELLLRQAQAAMADNRLLLPERRSAHHYLSRVLEIDPGNAQARTGVQQIVQRYGELAHEALAEGHFDKAELYVRRGLRVDPDHRGIRAVHADVKQGIAGAKLAAMRAAEVERMAVEFEPPEPVVQRVPKPRPEPPSNFESLMSEINGL